MSEQPKDPRYETVEEDPETLFIREEETAEQKERKAKAIEKIKTQHQQVLDKMKEKAGMASDFPSEEETLPGVEADEPISLNAVMAVFPDDDEDDEDEIQDFDDDDFDESDEALVNEVFDRTYKPVVKQVVYGFYGLSDADYLEDSTYQLMPNEVFRAEYILAFGVEGSAAFINSVKCGNTEQLIADNRVPASEFRCAYSLDLMIDRYFDAKSVNSSGIVYLTGDEIDGRGHGVFHMMLETVAPGVGIAITFTGKLRALLVIGVSPVHPTAEVLEKT